MTCGSSGGFFGILAFVHPLILLQAIPFRSAGHELPHSAGSYSRKGQWMESRFRLREIDQFRGHAFVPENLLNDFAVASASNQGILQSCATAAGKIIDVPDHGIG